MEDDKRIEELEKDFTAIRDEKRTCANTAFRIGSALLSLLALAKKTLLQSKEVAEVVTFLKGVVAKGVSYFNGIENTGDITNSGNIMTKNLTVTGKATFFELEIQKAKAAGGMSVNSAGTFHVDAVVDTKDGFVCYQRAEKDGVTLLQTCEPKDQMMCSNGMNSLPIQGRGDQTNDGKPHAIGNHYYWRLATKAPKEVVTHTIDGKEEKCLKLVLSKTDRHKLKNESPQDIGDIPKVGDDLVQIGNRDNKERQSVIMTCAYNSFDGDLKAPYWVQYSGVNDYKLSTHKRTWFAANGSQVTGNFKVQSENGGLKSIEDYMKGLTTNTVVWHVAFSIRNITGKQGETFRLKYGRTEGEDTSWYDDNPTYHGFNLLYAVIIDDATGNKQQAVLGVDLNVADFYTGGSLTVHLMNNKTGEILAQDTIYPEAKQGKDAVSYKLLPQSEKVLAYISEDKETKVKTNKVDLKLEYKIQKVIGEQVTFTTLTAEGMTLTIQPSVNKSETFNYDYDIDAYRLSTSITYAEIPDNSYTVTLRKGSNIVDQRIVPITFKPKVVFDIDTQNGKIRSEIKTVDGNVNSFKATIEKTSSTVGNLKKNFTLIEQTSKELSFTVNNGTRPNLLWGSDLNLDGVDTTNKAAIEKHLGVGLNQTRVDGTEYFQYIKGGGVAGSDAIMFKSKKDVARIVGLCYGGVRELRVKPHTVYTISAWLGFNSDGHQGSVFCDLHGWNEGKGDYDYATEQFTYSERQYDSQDIAKWTRCRWTFDTGKYSRIRLYMCCYTDKTQCEMYICRPKLEEGDTATPWCAYDGTVEGLKRTGIDIETGEITLDAEKTTVKGDLTARSLQTEGDPSKGGATIVAKGGMFTVYGVNKSVPGMEIGLNEAGEPVLKMYKNGKFMYDLGPDTIFEQVIERENAFTPCDMHRICNTTGNDMEKSFGGDFPSNYRKMVAYVFSEGYKRVGNQTRYKVSETKEISTYNGVHFAEQRSVSGINENELESMSRIADGWYLNGGGPRVSDPSEPAYDGSNPQGYTCRRFGVRYYSNGKATSKLGSFTVCGNSQTGWTVEKIDIPFL